MEPLSTQLYAFGIVLLAGVSLGLFFDLFRVIRGILRPGAISTSLLDLIFWVLITPLLILYLLLANWGELRFYVLAGLALGFLFYRLLLSGIVISLLLFLVDIVFAVLNFLFTAIIRMVMFPIILVRELHHSWGKWNGINLSWFKRFTKRPRLRWRK